MCLARDHDAPLITSHFASQHSTKVEDCPVNATTEQEAQLRRFAINFLGFGDFCSRYWFVGTEPGLSKNQDPFSGLRVWIAHGEPPTLSNRDYHLESGFCRWHVDMPPLQPTWRVLMYTLSAFLQPSRTGRDVTEWMRHEQAYRLGCPDSGTALFELGSLSAPNRSAWPYIGLRDDDLADRKNYERTFLEERAKRFHGCIREHEPRFVWLYGSRKRYMRYWDIIADGPFTPHRSLDFGYRVLGRVPVIVTDHVTYSRSNQHWRNVGAALRDLVSEARASGVRR